MGLDVEQPELLRRRGDRRWPHGLVSAAYLRVTRLSYVMSLMPPTIVRDLNLHLGLAETRHQVALGDEPAVHRKAVTSGGVELLAAHTEPNRSLGPALSTHHPGGTAARPVAEGGRFEQYHVFDAAFREQDGGPRPDRATAHHDDVSA